MAEWKNIHIVKTIITLFQEAFLSLKFWYHTCAIAIYLINRMPTSVLFMRSPFEVLFHSSPKLDHLKFFGCACYPSLKPFRINKLEPKIIQCIFLGYDAHYKGFIYFNTHTNKLIVSQHVLFDEYIFPAQHKDFGSHTGSSSKTQFIPNEVHSTTFHHPPLVLIPFPQVFSHLSSVPNVT